MNSDLFMVPEVYSTLSGKSTTQTPFQITVPGSKSITNRALLLATLADGTSTLRGVLFSDDSRHFLKCIQNLGFETHVDEPGAVITVKGLGGVVPRKEASLYVGSAGTAARFLTAYLGISEGIYHMDASPQMRKRPMAPLLNSLRELGCKVTFDSDSEGNPANPGHFPFTLQGKGFAQNSIHINIDESSQFLSALLISACLTKQDFTACIDGSHGMAYIEMTAKMMRQFGVEATPLSDPDTNRITAYLIPSGQRYKSLDYRVEPDVSAACYFYAMSPLLNIPIVVSDVHFDSLQGDIAFIRILEQMGCSSKETPEGILVSPPASGTFKGVTVDMSACSDQAITLAALAVFADGPTTITGIGHIRYQESNRIAAITTELSKMGIRCEEGESSITIYPGSPTPCQVETYDDHRMAMGFSLIGLRSPGIAIKDPGCCRKTFENYFDVLSELIEKLRRS